MAKTVRSNEFDPAPTYIVVLADGTTYAEGASGAGRRVWMQHQAESIVDRNPGSKAVRFRRQED